MQTLAFFVLPAVLFALVYFPAVTQLSRALVSPYAKADVQKRLFAATIDGLVLATSVILYLRLDAVLFLVGGATYLLLRDSVRGQSVGKFLLGLVAISLETGRPCTMSGSVRRNIVLLLPGANVVAVFLEWGTIVRDPQGQRLGDRLAQTQVVDGLGAKDVATAFQHWWERFASDLDRSLRRPDRRPVEVDRRVITQPSRTS
jgi:hypothetical protein